MGAPVAQADTTTSSLSAAVDDSFDVSTTDYCGGADFIDYGEGAPGGGSNDDFIYIRDYCADGHGVRAWAWLDGVYLGSRYYGGGAAGGGALSWDPFGNVLAGQSIGVKVCLVDGSGDTTGDNCNSHTQTSIDG
ncbi:hypothetical protein ACFUJU_30970 [Streptomyces sp. NPDC057235]|uniref:hypothetical protein n=1 Tax=Streptomyces sp. NPDC057235 TaxID=3346058 RepID=UPI003632E723